MSKVKALPKRNQVKAGDTWDLGSLFKSDGAWESAFDEWGKRIEGYEKFRGKLGQSARVLAECFAFDGEVDREGERLGTYAFLKTAEDQANSEYQRMLGRYRNSASRAAQASSYIRPEVLAIKPKVMEGFLRSAELEKWKIALERMLRWRPHTLGKKE